MKYICIFEDRKGFTKVLEFAQLPHEYTFIEYPFAGVVSTQAKEVRVTFRRKGDPETVYGQTVQKYRQE